MEDLWQNLKGPTSLAELATDQREANYGLIRHHYHLAIVMHATLVFTMKSVKPLSLFDTKVRKYVCQFKICMSENMYVSRKYHMYIFYLLFKIVSSEWAQIHTRRREWIELFPNFHSIVFCKIHLNEMKWFKLVSFKYILSSNFKS